MELLAGVSIGILIVLVLIYVESRTINQTVSKTLAILSALDTDKSVGDILPENPASLIDIGKPDFGLRSPEESRTAMTGSSFVWEEDELTAEEIEEL